MTTHVGITNEKARLAWKVALFLMGFAMGLLVLVPMSLFNLGMPQSSTVTLADNNYIPVEACPGDFIDYIMTWEINRGAVLVITFAHLRTGDGSNDTIAGQKAGERFVTNIPSARILLDEDAGFTVPEIPPGEYEYVLSVGTESEDTKPVFVVFPYTVRDDCPN